MKKICLFIVLLSFLVSSMAIAVEPEFTGAAKIGPQLKKEWQKAMESGSLDKKVTCILRTDGDANARFVGQLIKSGFNVKTKLKTVVTGSVEIGRLPYVVSLDKVDSIDAGAKIMLK